MPFVVMVAGPNGSGKTTFIEHLRGQGIDLGEYINPDDIAAELSGSYDERVGRAQQIADERRERCLAEGVSFSFETVMSHPSKIEFFAKATAEGFTLGLTKSSERDNAGTWTSSYRVLDGAPPWVRAIYDSIPPDGHLGAFA